MMGNIFKLGMHVLSQPWVLIACGCWVSILSWAIYMEAKLNIELSLWYVANSKWLYPLCWYTKIKKSNYYHWWYISSRFIILSCLNGSLYVVELTIGYETNLRLNAKRKKSKYKHLICQLTKSLNRLLGVFALECSSFLDMLNNFGIVENHPA